jgi:RNA polymerase-binding transcription factor DksA
MGATDRVTGALRRAVSNVRSNLPGSAEDAPPTQPVAEQPERAPATAPAKRAKKPTAKKPPATKPTATADKPAAKKPTAQRATTTRPTTKKSASTEPKPPPVEPKPPAKTPPAKKSAAKKPAAPTPSAAPAPPPAAPAAPAAPVWTAAELDGFREALEAEIVRLHEELDMGEADLATLIADSGDGAGDDQADAGAKTFEREHEMSVNANTREMLDQALRARRRLDAGTYGICESCGMPIAAARLRAFPRATLCITCKQAEERR